MHELDPQVGIKSFPQICIIKENNAHVDESFLTGNLLLTFCLFQACIVMFICLQRSCWCLQERVYYSLVFNPRVVLHRSSRCQRSPSDVVSGGAERRMLVGRKINAGTWPGRALVNLEWLPEARRGSSGHFASEACFVTYGYARSAPRNRHIGGKRQRSSRRILLRTGE